MRLLSEPYGPQERVTVAHARQRIRGLIVFDEIVLNAGLLDGGAGAVECLGDALPRLGLVPDRFVDPRVDQKSMADRVRGVDDLRELVRAETRIVDVGAGSGERVSIEHGAHGLRRA